MEYIVNPWLIYLLGISQNIAALCVAVGILTFVIGAGVTAAFFICGASKCPSYGVTIPANKMLISCGCVSTAVTVIILTACIMVAHLVPEREWIVGTAVAATMTEDRAETLWQKTKEGGGDIIDFTSTMKDTFKTDLIDIIEAVKNGEEQIVITDQETISENE